MYRALFLAHRLRTALVAALFALTLAAPASGATGEDYANQVGTHLIGRVIAPLRLTTVDGKSIDLRALRGRKAIYLKFWATWCSPCREQMPHFENVQRNAGSDLEVVAIDIGFDDTIEQIKAYRRELGLTMPIVRDDDGHLGAVFSLRVTPQHVIIGKDGRIAYVGHLADAKLDQALARARSAPASSAPQGSMPEPRNGATNDAAVTGRMPASLKTLENNDIAFADPAGKRRTVIAFLSPWCEGYFEKTRPESSRQCRILREQLAASGADSSVRWIGIASGLWASEADLREYRDEHHIPVPLILDGDGALFRHFGIRRVPEVIVLDAGGHVLQRIDIGKLGNLGLLDALSMHVVPARDVK